MAPSGDRDDAASDGSPDRRRARRSLPATQLLVRMPWVAVGLAALFVALAIAAAFERGTELERWDVPFQRRVIEGRTAVGTRVMLAVSSLGGTRFVVVAGLVLLGLAWRRSRPVAIVVLVSLAARPLLEFALKAIVHRPRPDVSPLVPGKGRSFPSGHVLAAISLWGVLPAVVALYTPRRALWTAAVVVAGVVIAGVALARVYLGVHWLTDVIGSLLLGALCLFGLEQLLTALDRKNGPNNPRPPNE